MALLTLGACESDAPPGLSGSVEGFAGAVVADEPKAATIGRDVLSAGGSAADAAIATYFALAVTMPSTAGLGGGGVCLAHDQEARTVEAIEFLPRNAPAGQVAVPANVRGMAALHARYGVLPWAQLLGSAEQLARFGTPISRALSRELANVGAALLRDPEMARVFANADGTPLVEGQNLIQPELATTLSRLRQNGAGDLYVGAFARSFAEAAQSIGAPLTLEALQATVPNYSPAAKLPYGNHILYVAPPPAGGGIATAQIIGVIDAEGSFDDDSEVTRAHLIAEASKQVFAMRERSADSSALSSERIAAMEAQFNPDQATPATSFGSSFGGTIDNPWSTGFVTADQNGNMVACAVTMNTLFGAKRMAPGTGIILAPATDAAGAGYRSLGPVILANPHSGMSYFAGAASGGETGITALANLFLRVADAEQDIDAAILQPRVHHNATPDMLFYEANMDPTLLSALQQRSHALEQGSILGRVNAIWCPDTLKNGAETCRAAADPRTFGLAIILDE
ncbi:MAG: gamma-glutamyltransferase [Dongiaceae bacterium]